MNSHPSSEASEEAQIMSSGRSSPGQEPAERVALQDPRTRFPAPPFPKQPQEHPGLAGRMEPKPDHGEVSYVGSRRLSGRRALITGGDSGIGRAVAIAYAREGADVAIAYLPSEASDAAEVVQLILNEGRMAVALPGDITDEAWCSEMVSRAVDELGGLDTVVLCAGHQKYQRSVSEVSTAQFDATMKTNLYALHWIAKAAVAHLPAGSCIITTASTQAYDPVEILLDYATTKAGIVAYTKVLSKQLINSGIRVNAVAPGPFWTPLQPSGGQPAEQVVRFGEETAFGRPGQPVEIAPVYVLLASNEASFITGEIYGVTGGMGIA